MENKVCKNKKCLKPLPEGYKHKCCEACRNQQAQKVKNGLKAVAGVAGSVHVLQLLLLLLERLILRNKMQRLPITGDYPVVRSLRAFMKLCIHINADAEFQFNCNVVIPDGDLLNTASHQCFIEFCKIGGLLRDVILQIIDSLYLLVSCSSVYGGLLAEFSKPEYFISNLVIGFFAVSLLDEFLLQDHQLFADVLNGSGLRSSDN